MVFSESTKKGDQKNRHSYSPVIMKFGPRQNYWVEKGERRFFTEDDANALNLHAP